MEEQKQSIPIDNPETISPSTDSPIPNPPPPDVHDELDRSLLASTYSESDERRPGLAQRLSEAFREGVASTKPDYGVRPKVRMKGPAKKKLQDSSDAGIMENIIQEGGSAAAVVGDKVASALGSVVEMVKKMPAITRRYTEAFREGAASVKPMEGGERKLERSSSAKKKWLPSGGGVILDAVSQSVDSMANIVRDVLTPVNVSGVGRKLRMCKKKIDDLYIEIGRETVSSWNNGSIETEKISSFLDELRKNEAEIRSLQEPIAQTAAVFTAETSRGQQQAATETVSTPTVDPAVDKEDGASIVSISEGISDEKIYHLADRQQEASEGVDFEVTDPPAPELVIEAEAAPQEEVMEEVIEEVIAEVSDQAMVDGTGTSQMEQDERPPVKGKGHREGAAQSERKRGRR